MKNKYFVSKQTPIQPTTKYDSPCCKDGCHTKTGCIKQNLHLVIQNLRITNKQEKLLVGPVSFRLSSGEIYALIGESGSGKTLIALSIIRLLHDDLMISSGKIYHNRKNLFTLSEAEMSQIRGNKIAMIFQNAMTALDPVMTVGKQLKEAMTRHNTISSSEEKHYLKNLLTDTGLPANQTFLNKYPHQLSGGQLQRIVIAMALCHKPQILIADEPTTALDITTQQTILRLMQQLCVKYQLTVLFVTHDLSIVRNMAHKIGVMYRGQLIEEKPTKLFFKQADHPYSQRLIKALTYQPKLRDNKTNQPLLTVKGLTVQYTTPGHNNLLPWKKNKFTAVNHISFTLYQHETMALVGESGSGKSTTGLALLNLTSISEGEIIFENSNIEKLNRKQMLLLRKKMQIIFQSPLASLNPRMTVKEILEEGMISLRPNWTAATRREKAKQIMKQVCLDSHFTHRFPHELSGGQQQRIAIARALVIEPELLICDEPTSALDMSVRQEILLLLDQLQKITGVTYLLITHDLSIVPQMAKRVAVMCQGHIVEQGEVEKVFHQPKHHYTRKLLTAFANNQLK